METLYFFKIIEKTSQSSEDGALSWLQWIAERSKLNQKTTTESPSTSTSTSSSITSPIKVLFEDVFQKYPGPPISQPISVSMERETTTIRTSSTTMSSSSSSSSASLADLGTWSWWNPAINQGGTKYEEYPLVESENENVSLNDGFKFSAFSEK